MNVKTSKRLLFVVNFDWRNIFQTGKEEFYEKLQRDQLSPEVNEFFFFSWAKETYDACDGKWCTAHRKTYGLEKLRPLLNFRALFTIPWVAYTRKVRPDVWVVYDFGMVPAVWLAHKLFGGVLIMIVNNQAQIYSQTRKFGKIKGSYSWAAERIGVPFVEHFFTLNETMRAYLKTLGVPRERTSIYTVNTIERDSEYIAKSKKGVIRNKYNISKDTKIILTVARLEAEKNYPLLLNLFSTLPSDYVLICLGMGSLLPQLQEQVENLGLQKSVFFPGFVERDKIWEYYKDADVFVLLSKAEALGIVFWEAMYIGVPTLGSDVQGIRESLGSHGERGRIWSEKDGEEGFHADISFCVPAGKERDTMLAQAKTFVDEQICNKQTINDFLSTYKKK